MPRKRRQKSSIGVYHIMLRGVNKQTIFEEDEDNRRFLKILKRYKDISKFELYGYCLMGNHVHLLMKETEETVSSVMKRINSSYVYWYNQKYDRYGPLFQDRFKSETVESNFSFQRVLRYIHQNPLKAGLAQDVFDYQWSSIHEYLQKENLVNSDAGLRMFYTEGEASIPYFIQYMRESNTDQYLDDERKIKVSDQEIWEYIHQLGVQNSSILQQMERDRRDAVISSLKRLNGVSVRQISRLTGISKSVIDRIR